MQIKKLNNFELRRQIFHIFLGLAIVVLLMYGLLKKETVLLIIIFGLILTYASKKIKIPLIYTLLERFERKEELKRFPGKGVILYFIGVYLTLLLFSKEIAMASIMVLALGDSVSHLFGLHYGKTKNPLSKKKLLEGTIAGFIAGFIGALVFVRPVEAFLGSLAAMIFEAIEIKIGTQQVDDNLIVPLVAGTVIWVVRLFGM